MQCKRSSSKADGQRPASLVLMFSSVFATLVPCVALLRRAQQVDQLPWLTGSLSEAAQGSESDNHGTSGEVRQLFKVSCSLRELHDSHMSCLDGFILSAIAEREQELRGTSGSC